MQRIRRRVTNVLMQSILNNSKRSLKNGLTKMLPRLQSEQSSSLVLIVISTVKAPIAQENILKNRFTAQLPLKCRMSADAFPPSAGWESRPKLVSWCSVSYLGLAEELLQLVLRQQTVVLHISWDFRRSLGFIVDCTMNLHVSVEDFQETLLALLEDQSQRLIKDVC